MRRNQTPENGHLLRSTSIYLAAHTQTIRPGPGRDYYQRRRDAGNSRNEALRALKRQLTKTIYRTLTADAARAHHNAAT